MSDNIPFKSDVNKFIATDEIGGVEFQRVKLDIGADGTAVDVQPPDADGKGATSVLPAGNQNYNGTSWDRQRGNLEGTAVASASRTTTTSSADFVNYNARGVHAILSVTSGTSLSLVTEIQGKDPISGSYYALNADPSAVTGTGLYVYAIYPGVGVASGGVTQRTSGTVPRTFRVTVTHGNANATTYSVAYALLL